MRADGAGLWGPVGCELGRAGHYVGGTSVVGGEWPAKPWSRLRGLEGKGEELGLRGGLGQRGEQAKQGEGESEQGLWCCWATGRGEKGVG